MNDPGVNVVTRYPVKERRRSSHGLTVVGGQDEHYYYAIGSSGMVVLGCSSGF